MISLDDVSIRIAIFVLALCGFFVARRIRHHKVKNKPLVCMVGFDCHTVVHSDYSRFLGAPVEFLGMIYYALVAGVYLISLIPFGVMPEVMTFYVLIIAALMWVVSLTAFLFSTYLIAVQIFILRKGCSWCIVSALISALIFVLSVIK
jgi:uncharacterized membrane protein